MFRFLFLLLTIAVIAAGSYFLYEERDTLKRYADDFRKEKKIYTLESSFSPEAIVTQHQKELLKDKDCTVAATSTLFIPYAVFDVKFVNSNKKTEEGRALFSLINGEMVLDTRTFETTHGFEDCILANATEEDFRLLHYLESQGGHMQREALAHKLSIDAEDLGYRLDALRKKHLIAVKGDTVRIHFQDPLLNVTPVTKWSRPIVIKDVSPEMQLSARYSKDKIRRIAQAAFGQDFAVRREMDVYLPVIEVDVAMKDGSIHKTYWNGITGKPVDISH